MNIQPEKLYQKVNHPEHGFGFVSMLDLEDGVFTVDFMNKRGAFLVGDNCLSFIESEVSQIEDHFTHSCKVYGLGEAEEWFLENRDANGVLCVHASGETKFCKTYPEAVDFFTS